MSQMLSHTQQPGNEAQAGTIQSYLADDVYLRTEDDVIAFAELMRCASPFSLRSLRVCVGKIGAATAAALVSLLSGMEPCAAFSHLEFDDEAEAFLASDPALPGAFASLTTIKILRMNNVGELGAGMLVNMKSSLVFADLWLAGGDAKTPLEDRRTSNPIHLLERSRHTLERLAVAGAMTDDNVSFEIQYPVLKAATLYFLDVPLTYDYVQAFPNLSELAVGRSMRFIGNEDIAECTRWRNANKEHQDEYGSWESLDVVTCNLLDAYVLGLRCPVERLELSTVGLRQRQRWCVSMMDAVLRDVRPAELRLTTECGRIVDEAPLLEFSLLASQNGLGIARLKTLAITLKITGRDRVYDVMKALRSLPRELGVPSLIRTFELVIDCSGLHAGEGDDGCTMADYLDQIDLKETTLAFMRWSKTVRVVRISTRDHRSRKDKSVVLEYDSGPEEEDSSEDGDAEEETMEGIGEWESSQQEVEMMIGGDA